jgi:hypothetical protein
LTASGVVADEEIGVAADPRTATTVCGKVGESVAGQRQDEVQRLMAEARRREERRRAELDAMEWSTGS